MVNYMSFALIFWVYPNPKVKLNMWLGNLQQGKTEDILSLQKD